MHLIKKQIQHETVNYVWKHLEDTVKNLRYIQGSVWDIYGQLHGTVYHQIEHPIRTQVDKTP